MANPPIDDVFKECFKAMDKGAKMKVNPKAHEALKTRYYASFDNQLKKSAKAWEKSREKVLHAAKHIGKLAGALASFEKLKEVGTKHAETAGEIMEQQCKPAFKGQWCEPFRQPQAD